MLDSLKKLFSQQLTQEQQQDPDAQVRLATAILLIEIGKADFEETSDEYEAIKLALKNTFDISGQELSDLMDAAENQEDASTSMYPYVQQINEHFSRQQKFQLLQSLWQVAQADGNIDKYEDYTIRKISELLYLPHSDFIKAKLSVIKAN